MKEEKLIPIPVEISARHIHLTQKHFETLFGKKEPTFYRKLGQSQFACQEKVCLKNKDKEIKNVRLVAPFRKKSQVEISITDAFKLDIKPVIRVSGDLKGTPSITLIGPRGKVKLKEGVIVAQRHLHLNEGEAKKFSLKNGEIISVLIKGKRAVIFGGVVVRVNEKFNCCLHLDTDEGNACGITKKGRGFLPRTIKKL